MPFRGRGAEHGSGTSVSRCDERGSAVVDFVLVGGLLTVFFLAIVQLTLVLHVRNTAPSRTGHRPTRGIALQT